MANHKNKGPRLVEIDLPDGKVKVYANVKVRKALDELMKVDGMTVYHGARFSEVAQALYEQGLVDGRRQAFEAALEGFIEVRGRPELKSTNPGRPPRKAPAKKAPAKKAPAKKAPAKKAPAK